MQQLLAPTTASEASQSFHEVTKKTNIIFHYDAQSSVAALQHYSCSSNLLGTQSQAGQPMPTGESIDLIVVLFINTNTNTNRGINIICSHPSFITQHRPRDQTQYAGSAVNPAGTRK